MKTNQLTKEQVALFLQSDSAIQGTLQAVSGIAYTDEDIQKQKEFNIAWTQFKIQVQGLGDVLIRTIVPVFTWIIQKATAITKFMNEHAQMLKIIGGLLSVAFGNVLIMQMMKGIGLGARLVAVFKYLTQGFALFSKALWASPLTWYIAALGGLLIILEDIYYFITGTKNSFTGNLLRWLGFSEEDINDLRQEFLDLGDIFARAWDDVKEALKPIGDMLAEWGITGGKGFLRGLVGIITLAILGIVRLMAMIVKFAAEFGGAIGDALRGDTKALKEMLLNIANTLTQALGGAFFQLGEMIGKGLLSMLKKIPFMNELIGDIENGTSNFKFGDILKYTPVNGMTGGLAPRIVNYFQEKMTQNNNINIDSNDPKEAGGSVVRALNSSKGTNLPRDWGWAHEVWVQAGVQK